MNNVILAPMLLGSLLASVTQTVFAQGTIYTSRALFEQQLSSSTTITMESLTPSTLGEVSDGRGYFNITVDGVSFLGGGTMYVASPGSGVYPVPGDGQYIWNSDSFSPVSILLPGGVTAFGADFAGAFFVDPTTNGTLTVNLAGGGSYDFNFVGNPRSFTFFGVSFTEPIASLIYSDYDFPSVSLHNEKLDNVTFGSVIPEPSTLGLLAVGAALFGWRRFRNRG